MWKVKWVVTVVALFMLTGCFESFRKRELVVETTWVVVEPDPVLVRDCPVEPPPNKQEYAQMGISEREYALIVHNGALIRDIVACNKDKAGIREQIQRQKQTIEEKNLQEKERVKKLRE